MDETSHGGQKTEKRRQSMTELCPHLRHSLQSFKSKLLSEEMHILLNTCNFTETLHANTEGLVPQLVLD